MFSGTSPLAWPSACACWGGPPPGPLDCEPQTGSGIRANTGATARSRQQPTSIESFRFSSPGPLGFSLPAGQRTITYRSSLFSEHVHSSASRSKAAEVLAATHCGCGRSFCCHRSQDQPELSASPRLHPSSTPQTALSKESSSPSFLPRVCRHSIRRNDLVTGEFEEDLPHLTIEFAYQHLDSDGPPIEASQRVVRDGD